MKLTKESVERISKLVRHKDFRLFLVFVVISLLIWLSEQFRKEYVLTVNCPIKCYNIPEHYTINEANIPMVQLTIRGDGFGLFAIDDDHLTLDIDVENANKKFISNVINAVISPQRYLSSFQKNINNETLELVNISPDSIYIPLLTLQKKRVPVIVRSNAKPEAQHIFSSEPLIEPSSVWISGTNDKIDTITALMSEEHDNMLLHDTVSIELNIEVPEGVNVSDESVRVTYYVEPFTEKSVKASINAINVPEGYIFKPFPQTVRVSFSVGINSFEKITENDFVFTADLKDVKPGSGASRIKLRLQSSPKGVINISYSPMFIEYLLVKDKTTKTEQ